jgi:hypothetical protein
MAEWGHGTLVEWPMRSPEAGWMLAPGLTSTPAPRKRIVMVRNGGAGGEMGARWRGWGGVKFYGEIAGGASN